MAQQKIEELLQNMPKATMNAQVKQRVYESLMLKKEEIKKPRFSFPSFGFTPRSFAFACAVLVLIIGGTVMFKNSMNPLRPSLVSAAEILKRNIANFFRPNTIYHVTYKHFVDYKGSGNTQPTIYDLWEDRNSDRFYQEITYPDGNRSWQGFDTNTRWTIDFNEKTVMEDLYVWTNPAEKEVKHGDRVDMSAQFDELITNGQLEAKEGVLDTKPVYVVYDTRKSPDKLWDILTFDKDSFALLQTETKNAAGDGVGQLVLYEKQEVLDRTPENLEKLFSFRSPGEDFTILTRHFDPNNGGYIESEYQKSISSPTPTSNPNVVPTTSESNNWRTYTGKTFSFQYPNSWANAIEDVLSTRTEVMSEGNLVVSDGVYYSQSLDRAQTYQEYVNQVIPKSIKTIPFNLGNLNGVRYMEEDNSGRSVVNIILSDKPASTRVFSIIYLSPVADLETINSILDPILATFKFTQ